eukprot:TRINITY_DN20193_c0_g1::TRINITY_DN20193_c0_g1_i1::g.30351::m.30351 TRINITY_DN20193_c0_g1::TRINITY_DN20193_c0_g1_i1::g.30351  ORF type:complete len:401 (+),score=100.60,sp/Q54LT0/MCU_DICDI/36.80/1e-22,DUF607/PF04678.8/1.9e-33,LRS4/PF10422.4/0.00066,OmpH/PF03938.9/1.1e+03,OmpH/PF03938.9/2.2,OmpH/PF03938.9/0.57,Lectin_N/PF03954.9/0.1,Lectin_N/PF03954.9/4.2,DUF3584/PF12128.3/0.1,RE_Alw26IDE/PF09665.5/0.15,HAUS6_N/PF14661.1/0.39,CENP-F_leu_zip/PF10473.4/0.34,CENP-F_leu_zip/PF10473.4/4.9e+02,DUF1664/PF
MLRNVLTRSLNVSLTRRLAQAPVQQNAKLHSFAQYKSVLQPQHLSKQWTRAISTTSDTSSRLTIQEDSVVIPLPSGPCRFTIAENQSVKQFLENIQAEDEGITKIEITSADECRVAKSDNMEPLGRVGFRLTLNDKTYMVQPTPSMHGLQRQICGELVGLRSTFSDFKSYLQAELRKAQSEKLTAQAEIQKLSSDLNSTRSELKARDTKLAVLIDERKSTESKLKDELQVLRATVEAKEARIAVLKAKLPEDEDSGPVDPEAEQEKLKSLTAELEKLNKQQAIIDRAANRRANLIVWGGVLALTGNFALFARLTWWEFSWDIMEPVTFFWGFSLTLASVIYFGITKRDYTNEGFRAGVLAARKSKLYKKYKFSTSRVEELNKMIDKCKSALTRAGVVSSK